MSKMYTLVMIHLGNDVLIGVSYFFLILLSRQSSANLCSPRCCTWAPPFHCPQHKRTALGQVTQVNRGTQVAQLKWQSQTKSKSICCLRYLVLQVTSLDLPLGSMLEMPKVPAWTWWVSTCILIPGGWYPHWYLESTAHCIPKPIAKHLWFTP